MAGFRFQYIKVIVEFKCGRFLEMSSNERILELAVQFEPNLRGGRSTSVGVFVISIVCEYSKVGV